MMRVRELTGTVYKVVYKFSDGRKHTRYMSVNADVLGKINRMYDTGNIESWQKWVKIYHRATAQAARASVIRQWGRIDEKVVILSVEEVESF